jgi:dihydropteroate synthase
MTVSGTPAARWRCGRHSIALDHVQVMGILNVTPDSFSDGGQFNDPGRALEHAWQLIDDGATILDIGAESTRPGAPAVPAGEQLRRCLSVVRALRDCPVPISVDTSEPEVMVAVVAEGASIINDVRSFELSGAVPAMLGLDCGLVVMHRQGNPQTMQLAPQYADVIAEVSHWLNGRCRVLIEAGIDANRLAIDPGFGFGKTAEHNTRLLAQLGQLAGLGYPVLAGLSRKSFLGHLTDRSVDQRLVASVTGALLAVCQGARIVRVHDVAATRDAMRVWAAVHSQQG